jgi:hypothetical protein
MPMLRGQAICGPRGLLFLVDHGHCRHSAGGRVGSCKCADGNLADNVAVAVLNSLCSLVCVLEWASSTSGLGALNRRL